MSNANDAAFPHLAESCQRVNESEHAPGLTKREYAAIQIATGICAAEGRPGLWDDEFVVKKAAARADLLLAELAKERV